MATRTPKPSSRAKPSGPRASSSTRSADSLANELVVVREELRHVDQKHARLVRAHSHMRSVVVVTAFVLLLYAALHLLYTSSREGR